MKLTSSTRWALGIGAAFGAMAIEGARLAGSSSAESADLALAALLGGLLPPVAIIALWSFDPHADVPGARFGRSRRGPLFASAALSMALVSLLFAALCGGALVATRGVHDPLFSQDLLATLPIATLGSLAVVGLVALARVSWGKLGALLILLGCWTLGQAQEPISGLLPTGHIRHLLGVGPGLPLPQWGSMAVLAVVAASFIYLTRAKIPR